MLKDGPLVFIPSFYANTLGLVSILSLNKDYTLTKSFFFFLQLILP